jgi:hypothetical protein
MLTQAGRSLRCISSGSCRQVNVKVQKCNMVMLCTCLFPDYIRRAAECEAHTAVPEANNVSFAATHSLGAHAGKPHVPANIGHVTMPEQEQSGYATHPALGDACIHLAAVPPAHADSVRMRSVISSRIMLLINFI